MSSSLAQPNVRRASLKIDYHKSINSYNQPKTEQKRLLTIWGASLTSLPFIKLKTLNYHKTWDHIYIYIYISNPIVVVKPKNDCSLPFNHGYYNEFEHLNTYSTHNYIPFTNRVNMLFPNVDTMASIMKRR